MIEKRYVMNYELAGKRYSQLMENKHRDMDPQTYVNNFIDRNAIWVSIIPIAVVVNDNI